MSFPRRPINRPERRVVGTGGPTSLSLDMWAAMINRGFDTCYLVGSATRTKQRRDVDVVCILDDDVYASIFGERSVDADGRIRYSNSARWTAVCAAFSMWASDWTGLPIDFKFQQRTDANARHDGMRLALGIFPTPQPYDPVEVADVEVDADHT